LWQQDEVLVNYILPLGVLFSISYVELTLIYDWRIRADKPLLKALSFLLKPIFSANHRWAMSRGLDSLKLALARRRAATPEDAAKIPPPPGPTFPHNLQHRKGGSIASHA
jgi:hypothetical protein